MKDQNDPRNFELTVKEREFTKTVNNWLAQYDEEDSFLNEKVFNSLPDLAED